MYSTSKSHLPPTYQELRIGKKKKKKERNREFCQTSNIHYYRAETKFCLSEGSQAIPARPSVKGKLMAGESFGK
jgi:hypothetical protein